MPLEHKTHTVTAEEAGRADLILKAITGRSRSQLRGMCMNGCLSINGRAVTEPSTAVKEGDVVDVKFDPQRKYRETWLGKFQAKSPQGKFQCKTFSVVFEDNYLIVVDKQAGILTVPTENQESRTLVEEVSRYLGGQIRSRSSCIAWIAKPPAYWSSPNNPRLPERCRINSVCEPPIACTSRLSLGS